MKNILRYVLFVILGILPMIAFAQTAPLMPSQTSCANFNKNLSMGLLKDPQAQLDVLNLQLYLVKEGFTISPLELSTFGKDTKAAVIAFQERYVDDILAPFGLKKGTGYVGAVTRLKLQALYGCKKSSEVAFSGIINLAITALSLDSNGVSVTFCNQGKNDLPTAPFRIRLNGINRDFEAIGAQKAGTCTSDTWKYETWGLSYDPGSTFSATGLIDPNNFYKDAKINYPLKGTGTLSVPSLPGNHLSVRSMLLKSNGVQATFCNLGTTDLTSFPVRTTLNGTSKDFDISGAYKSGQCQTITWTYDNWGLIYTPGTTYNVIVTVDPNNKFTEVNKFDNTAAVIGTP